MDQVVTNFRNQLTFKGKVNEDNYVFKLVSKISVGICIACAAIVASNTYIGDPIHCNKDDSIDQKMFEAHCWIHGTFHLPDEYKVDRTQYCSYNEEDEGIDTHFYQWVVFMLIANAIILALPNRLWKGLEGGMISRFVGSETTSSYVACNMDSTNQLSEEYAKYFRFLMGRHKKYFAQFVLCELLNVMTVGINFWITDIFLSRKFSNYGSSVIQYHMLSDSEQESIRNPRCNVFPTTVFCEFHAYQGRDTTRRICILSQNVINEKIYLFLWLWFIFLMCVSSMQFLYRICVIVLKPLRTFLLRNQLVTSNYCSQLDYFMEHECDVGDWFVLRQISKNVDPYFFEQLIGDLTENIPVDTMPASNGRQTGRIYPTPNSRKIEVSFMKDKHGV